MLNKKRWTIIFTAVILCTLTVTGYFAVSAEYGSQDDPLVTLSYITDVLSPQTNKLIDDAFSAKKKEFDEAIDKKMGEIDTKIQQSISSSSSGSGGSVTVDDAMIESIADQVIAKMSQSGDLPSTGTVAASWKVITVPAGKTLVGQVGCEILPRFGTMTCVASASPGLINLTSGAELANGGTLLQNNLYLVTVQGRGAKATTDATILVNGSYTIQ